MIVTIIYLTKKNCKNINDIEKNCLKIATFKNN